MVAIALLHRDLRLRDNPVLTAAAKEGEILCLYIDDDENMGSASRWWLQKSLTMLKEQLEEQGVPLIYRRGKFSEELQYVLQKSKAASLHYGVFYEPHIRQRTRLIEKLPIYTEGHFTSYLIKADALKAGSGEPYKVFTPFYNAFKKEAPPCKPLPMPLMQGAKVKIDSSPFEKMENWSKKFAPYWTPGEEGALKRFAKANKDAIQKYENQRDIPSIEGTSRLSAHLHFGEISPSTLWYSIQGQCEPFRRQLIWREFFNNVLYHNPKLRTEAMRPEFESFEWDKGTKALKAWQEGRTGYPIVDAAMRELWETGWMHNRARMIVGSFLIKDLLLDWRKGEAWFWDCLLDADAGNNGGGWQWVAGCGTDAAPYFRIFNPITQSKKFDPDGTYIKRWLPELESLDSKAIHAPWEIDHNLDYPDPLVDHDVQRKEALNRFHKLK